MQNKTTVNIDSYVKLNFECLDLYEMYEHDHIFIDFLCAHAALENVSL